MDANLVVKTNTKVETRDDLKWIKKNYGEKFMQKCRTAFPRILEYDGALSHILAEHFQSNSHLYDDLNDQYAWEEFESFVYMYFNAETTRKVKKENESKSAVELMREAGYVLYPECLTEEEIQSFRHYYFREDGKTPEYSGGKPKKHEGEEICTFDGGRLNKCRVWFAVKDDADKLKREDFTNPTRQDDYGKSVVSIQFTRARDLNENSTLSIKNRYNHTVKNPDNTFNSNLDNIIEGLTDAFERDYGVRDHIEKLTDFELDGYVNVGNKFYKYNYEINGIHYCEKNIIVEHGRATQLSGDKILVDYFIFDLKNNTISLYDSSVDDCFPEIFGEIEKIDYKKTENKIIIKVKDGEDVVVQLDNQMRIVGIINNNIKTCGFGFMYKNTVLSSLEMNCLEECGNRFLYYNSNLESLSLPSLIKGGNQMLRNCKILKYLSLPNCKEIGGRSFERNQKLEVLDMPSLIRCGDNFFYFNMVIKTINFPNLKKCGSGFLYSNRSIEEAEFLSLIETGKDFMSTNNAVKVANFPNLIEFVEGFLAENTTLENLQIANSVIIGKDVLQVHPLRDRLLGLVGARGNNLD